MFLPKFKEAAGEGAVIELKLRLLAAKVPALQKFAHAQKLEDVETEIANHFGDALSAQDKTTLELCRKLRNKILHSDFRAAREKLQALGQNPASAGVVKLPLPNPTKAEAEKLISEALAGKAGIPVTNTSRDEIAGWLMEAGASGDFQLAVDEFQKAGAIVDRLAEIE
jgi:hypothetical protein